MGVTTRLQVVPAKVRAPRPDCLGRDRLEALLGGLWQGRLGLVVAPAGSGKTTLAASFAARAGVPVAWYRAESWDGRLDRFLAHLQAALAVALGEFPDPWTNPEDVARALDACSPDPALLVIDDLHVLEGTPAEAALERLLDYCPSWLAVLAVSRTLPALNLPRLRVSGAVLELGADDLRFRSWEVERLFRDFYREPLPPTELAELARRTEGWAAGLQLFYLAARQKSPEERRRLLAGLSGGSRLVYDYLAANVLRDLPAELRGFLLETCALGRLSGTICDRLLGRSDSRSLLRELERRQIFTQPLGEEDYRYHEVLRSHLEVVVAQQEGEAALHERHRRAAAVLEEAQLLPEALHSYCRAEDWLAVERLLGREGEALVGRSGAWIDTLPPALLEHDPWLLLARARRQRAQGDWHAAVLAYQGAEQAFGSAGAAEVSRRERLALASWLRPGPVRAPGLLALLRAATQRGPAAVRDLAGDPPPVEVHLLAGVAALVAGHLGEARRMFAAVEEDAEAGSAAVTGARLGLGVARLLSGDPGGSSQVAAAVEAAERFDLPFLARLGQACLGLAGGRSGPQQALAVAFASGQLGDAWGSALAQLLAGLAWAKRPDREQAIGLAPVLDQVSSFLERADASALEAWSRALLALALSCTGKSAEQEALRAERLAGAMGLAGPAFFAYLAMSLAEPARRDQYRALADGARAATGLSLPDLPVGAEPCLPVQLQLFGGFRLTVEGRPLDLSALKPRSRALLRLLAVQGGRPVHRETLQVAFWPDAEAASAARSFHVALSSLRQALAAGSARGSAGLVVREGDAYRLALDGQYRSDVADFEEDIAAARRARAAGQVEQSIACLQRALEGYRGDLLPEDGAAEWVVEPRERLRSEAVEAAQVLAELLLSVGRAGEAAQACSRGLHIDRYHDPLWRLLVVAREQAGDRVAAARARRDYQLVLAELGLPTSPR